MNLDLKVSILKTGKTQTEICRLTGINEARLSRIIYEYNRPRKDEKEKLAAVLNKSVSELFPEVGEAQLVCV